MLSKSPFSRTFETLVLSWEGLKVGRGVVAELAELASNREGFALEDPIQLSQHCHWDPFDFTYVLNPMQLPSAG